MANVSKTVQVAPPSRCRATIMADRRNLTFSSITTTAPLCWSWTGGIVAAAQEGGLTPADLDGQGVVNNSTNAQVLNVPIIMPVGQTFRAVSKKL